jgi:hypothetical protein
MGFGRFFLRDMTSLKRSGALDGLTQVVEIGAQQLSDYFLNARDEVDHLYSLFGKSAPDFGAPVGRENFTDKAPPSGGFWASLGFDKKALEYDHSAADIQFDLNRDTVSDKLRGAFQLAVNCGTTEHIANQDNAFRAIHDLLCDGGIAYHNVPAGGWPTHGLVSYTLMFFWTLCRVNEYEVLFLRMEQQPDVALPENVIASNIQFASDPHCIRTQRITPFMINTALRKRGDKPFATPLDVPDG